MWTLVIDGQFRNGTFTMKLNNDIMATPKQQTKKIFDTTSMAQCKTAVTPLLKHSEFLQSCTEPSLAVMFLFVFCIVDVNCHSVTATSSCSCNTVHHEIYPDSKVRGANIGPTWGRQDPGGPTGPRWVPCWPMNFTIWVYQRFTFSCFSCSLLPTEFTFTEAKTLLPLYKCEWSNPEKYG